MQSYGSQTDAGVAAGLKYPCNNRHVLLDNAAAGTTGILARWAFWNFPRAQGLQAAIHSTALFFLIFFHEGIVLNRLSCLSRGIGTTCIG